MSRIYANSVLTISAASAPNGEHGCFSHTPIVAGSPSREITLSADHKYFGAKDGQNSPVGSNFSEASGIFVRMNQIHNNFKADSFFPRGGLPLFERAWAFQERLLAARVVHFTDSELIWECTENSKCQCGGIVLEFETSNKDAPPLEILPRMLKTSFAQSFKFNSSPHNLVDQWKKVVFQYSGRKLSHDADRLPALSGLAHKFLGHSLGRYYAGLWENELDEQILWRCFPGGESEKRSSEYIAPTWSWASLNRGVHFIDLKLRGDPALWYTQLVGSILEVNCLPGGLDPLGSLVGGHLRVLGQMIRATLIISADEPDHSLYEAPLAVLFIPAL